MAPLLLSLLVSCIFSTSTSGASVNPPKFSAVLFFGDSTLDTGNNDYVQTNVKGNHFPYGQDFAGHVATGRFSDGLLVPDLLISELGIKQLAPPFLDPKLSADDIKTGVNFASAGSGLDDWTSTLMQTVSMLKQVEMFRSYRARLKTIAGEEETARILGNALLFISAGTNDLVFNYYDIPTRRVMFNMSAYQDLLLDKLQALVKDMHGVGGRRFCVVGLPPVGCIPLQITARFNSSSRACVDEQNSDAGVFNSKLQKLLPMMQTSLPSSKFAYVDLYGATMEILNNPAKYGFEETRKGCCGTGLLEVGPLCNRLTPLCQNLSTHVFFDAVHPTEKVYRLVTAYIMEHAITQLQ